MIDPSHLLKHVIRPVLKDIGLHSENAERQVLGTACVESDCGLYLVQLGDVKAGGLGIFQMEKITHDDCWSNFLTFRPELAGRITTLCANKAHVAEEMVGNLYYATAMARVKYLRDKHKIPDTLEGQAENWKRVYNSHLGAGTVKKYLDAWHRLVPTAALT